MIQFSATYDETLVIIEITKRAAALGLHVTSLLCMDLDTVHSNGCPLRLDDLLIADEGNFAHDITGISAHLNRRTGRLEDCFEPRFARHE